MEKYMELEEVLLKEEKPSVYFEQLREQDRLSVWFPELEELIDVEQDAVHHPEGSVWNHTMMVLDAAAALRADAENPLGFMFSALCHDFGKTSATTAKNGKIHAYGHETAGMPMVKRFLDRLTVDEALCEYVLNMTKLHMRPNMLVRQHAREKAFMKMFRESVCPEDLLLLAKADHLGRGAAAPYGEMEKRLRECLQVYKEQI